MHLKMHTNKKLFSHPISSTGVHFLSLPSLTQVECIVEREKTNLHEMTTGGKMHTGCREGLSASLACTVPLERHFTDSYAHDAMGAAYATLTQGE
jgi:hypothetical protein